MSLETAKVSIAKAFNEFAKTFDEMEIDFMGGEPLMEFPLIKSIAEWVWSNEWPLPYVLFATTNGTLLHGDVKKWFLEHKEHFVLSLSCDGAPHSQDNNRTHSSEKIDISFFAKTWPYQPVKMTVSPYTIDTLCEDTIYIHQQGIVHIAANLAFGEKWEKKHLTVYKEQLLKLSDYYLSHPELSRTALLDMNLSSILEDKYTTKYCGAGTGMVFVDIDGSEYPCHILSPLTLNGDQLNVAKSVDFKQDVLFSTKYCRDCLFYNLCPNCIGMNFLHNGGFNRKSQFMCDATKIQILVNSRHQYMLLKKQSTYTAKDNSTARAILKIKHAKINL